MKRLKRIWPEVLEWRNLLCAYRKARRGKQDRQEVALFSLNLECELADIRSALQQKTYQPGAYRQFEIYDRKPRLISAAPFRDRVVQHALMNVVEPLLDKRFIYDSYACRRHKGVHKAVDRYQAWAGRYAYVLKLDISRYFFSIDHARLKEKLRRSIGDEQVLWLFERIIDSSPPFAAQRFPLPDEDLVDLMERPVGIPVGNLTSQFFGNLFLNDLDHFIKQKLRQKAYLRYVDDLFILGDSKAELWHISKQIETFLQRERLLLHPKKIQVISTREGVGVLGYRVWPHKRRLQAQNVRRQRKRMRRLARDFAMGEIELDQVQASVASWVGHAKHADTYNLRKNVLSSVVFTKLARHRGAAANDSSRASRRRLEQQTGERAFCEPQQEPAR